MRIELTEIALEIGIDESPDLSWLEDYPNKYSDVKDAAEREIYRKQDAYLLQQYYEGSRGMVYYSIEYTLKDLRTGFYKNEFLDSCVGIDSQCLESEDISKTIKRFLIECQAKGYVLPADMWNVVTIKDKVGVNFEIDKN